MPTERSDFLGVGFDRISLNELLGELRVVTPATPYRYVVTPNVDHVVQLNKAEQRGDLLPLYEQADISVCDSRVLQGLARLHGLDLPLVPGSDLTVHLLDDVVRAGDRIGIVGGDATLLDEVQRLYPGIDFVQHVPPMGLRRNRQAREEAARFVADSKARFTLICVGAPQQEMIAAAVHAFPQATGVALCVGASLDFIVGRQRRAPRVLQRLSLEWAHRLLSDPKRMWRRYLVEGPRIFMLALSYDRKRSAR